MTETQAKQVISEWYTTRSTPAAIAKRVRCTEDGVTRVIQRDLFPHLRQPELVPHFRKGTKFPVFL